jgi:UDP-N-acetylmuramoyl-L-alanyl-D-glutamate--2,6-diaminopimelate ligase
MSTITFQDLITMCPPHELTIESNLLPISAVTIDSRTADSESIFVAIPGFKKDGHDFLQNARDNGCRNFVISNSDAWKSDWSIDSNLAVTSDTRLLFADLCRVFHGNPAGSLFMAGITGTKGKTSVTSMLYAILRNVVTCSMFSTVQNSLSGELERSYRTTMEADALQSRLKRAVDTGSSHAIVEVSSHAMTLHRVAGIDWDLGIFTSFSQDHLDLYGTMENYFQAKCDFFRALNRSAKKNKLAVINLDDPRGSDIVAICNDSVQVVTVSSDPVSGSDTQIYRAAQNKSGLDVEIVLSGNRCAFHLPVLGSFNVVNAALAATAARWIGVDVERIAAGLEAFNGVKGRFDLVCIHPFHVIIDYAHTPESLLLILKDARKMAGRKLLCLFGCTGERDSEKRPIMGKIAAEQADYSIITNDDTYDEAPVVIAGQVETGFLQAGKIRESDYSIVLDRAAAVKIIIERAQPGDVVVIAGKGHETVQYLAGGGVPYSDHETVREILEGMGREYLPAE